MKTISFLVLSLVWMAQAQSQVICVRCYYQNPPLNPGAPNMVLNGGFENFTGTGFTTYYCPTSTSYNGDLVNWTCTGGGPSTYAQIFTNSMTVIPEGTHAVYMGNYFCHSCSATDGDTACLDFDSCIVQGVPTGYPNNTPAYGGATGVSLSQTINGLVPGNVYILEFWSGGEDGFAGTGIFAFDIGFGNMFITCRQTPPPNGVGKRFCIVFRAIASSQVLKFTNWGHISYYNSEPILDDVQVYKYEDAHFFKPDCFVGPVFTPLTVDTMLCRPHTYSVNGHTYSQNGTYMDTIPQADTLHYLVQTTHVSVYDCDDIYVPNAFSPNGDGVNDLFHVLGIRENVIFKDLRIYNRWGQLVFQTDNINTGWDGTFQNTPQEIGVYVYVLHYATVFNPTTVLARQGNITLMR